MEVQRKEISYKIEPSETPVLAHRIKTTVVHLFTPVGLQRDGR